MSAQNTPTDCDVAIVGYGPTGATLANLLALCGVRVTVLEREADIYPLPRAVHFDGEVMRVFQTVGIGDELEKKIRVNPGMRFVDPDGELLLDWPRPQEVGPNGWHASYRFHQPDLEQLLRDSFESRTGARVLHRAEVFAIDEHKDMVQLRYEDHDSGDIRSLTAKYVVGCDGARSLVRRFIGAPLEDLGFKERWLVVDVLLKRSMPELGDHSIQFCDPRRPMTYCRSPENRRRWEITVLDSERSDEVTRADRIWSFLSRWITPDDADLERSAVYTFRSAVATQWRRGRLLIAGDAAHLTPPFMGQGMCAGVRDAANLAWKLARCLGGESSDSILDSYGSERRSHARAYIETAIRLGGLINSIDREGAIQLGEKGDGRSTTMQSITPRLGDGLAAGLQAHTGTLFPQPLLASGQRLDDICGYRPVLITREPVERTLDFHSGSGVDRLSAHAEPALLEYLDELDADAVLIRPDRYIVGTAKNNDQLDELIAYSFYSPSTNTSEQETAA